MRHGLVLLAVCCALFFTAAAQAQITRTARIELNDLGERTYITPYAHQTIDENGHLTYQAVLSRHLNNMRGAREQGRLLNFESTPAPVWLVFSVTNNTREESWVIDFGHLFQGRMGQVQRLFIHNYERDETYIDWMLVSPVDERVFKNAIAVDITPGKTETFVVMIQHESGLPGSFAPSILSQQHYLSGLHFSPLLCGVFYMVLIGLIGFFAAVAFFSRRHHYALFCGYYGLNLLLLFFLSQQFFASFSLSAELTALLLPFSAIAGLGMTKSFFRIEMDDYAEHMGLFATGFGVIILCLFFLLPIPSLMFVQNTGLFLGQAFSSLVIIAIAFLRGQRGRLAGHFYASAQACGLAGLLISGLSLSGVISSNALGLSFYWLMLLPQAFFFVVACAKDIEQSNEEERTRQARDIRADQALSRLKESKESADQARLLRIIERERELMADLRERESQRAEDMRKAKDLADDASKAKSAFLAVVSHEIRTPMTGIMGVLKLLQGTKLSKEQSDYLLTIQRSGDTMITLLNDILDFEKIDTGRMTLENISFDLPHLVQGIVTLMSGHVAGKNITLSCEIAPGFPQYLRGDPTRLRQVLLNLVSNAVKFTEGGHVKIILRATKLEDDTRGIPGDYEVYFAVKDTGIGLSQDAQETLFSPFQQADSSVARKYGGSGLGLAICQRLVSLMGGHIQIDSTEGVGSTFHFSVLMSEGEASDEDEAASYGDGALANIPPMTIMVIEDNEVNRKVIRSFVENNGHHTILCESGEDALERLNEKPLDAILADVNLTGMSGLDVTRHIRGLKQPNLARLPIVGLTGNVGDDDVRAMHKAGMSAMIAKPIDYDFMMSVLADIHYKRLRFDHPALREDPQPQAKPAAAPPPAPAKAPQKSEKKPKPKPKPKTKTPPPTGRAPSDYLDGAPHSLTQDDQLMTNDTPPSDSPKGKGEKAPVQEYFDSLQDEDGQGEEAVIDIGLDPDIFDPGMLGGLLSSLGADAMDELIKSCLDKTDEISQDLQNKKHHKDAGYITERAHELKGMCGNFGLKEIAGIAEIAEKAARERKLDEALEASAKLPDAYGRALKGIEKWLENARAQQK